MRTKRSAQVPAVVPDRVSLHEAAVSYLARYAANAAAVRRVLQRRIDRWAAQQTGDRAETAALAQFARGAAEQVVAALIDAGAINDATYADSRARSLARSGRSGRAIAAHLLSRGIGADMAAASGRLSEADELAAALALARRRRIGPFRGMQADPGQLQRETAIFARAGFSRSIAGAALRMPMDEAEVMIRRLKST